MTRILYAETLAQSAVGDIIEIAEDEAHYLRKVRRHRAGDAVVVQDLDGIIFEAVVDAVQKQSARLRLVRPLAAAGAPTPVHVLSAVPKGSILDDSIRQLSELGVERFSPVICERSSVVPGDQRVERWRRIARQSVRQCRRSRPLDILDPVSFAEAVLLPAANRWMLHPENGIPAGVLLGERRSGDAAVLVGPEGGFTETEVQLADRHGFQSVVLGKTILRIETALIVASVTCVTLMGGFDA